MDSFTLDFAGIGAARSGTTWIAACLAAHPNICLSKPKELHFFCNNTLTSYSNLELGESWYINRFSHCKNDALKGEISTSYLHDLDAPQRLKNHFPHIKLIATLRNPTDALYSHYYHSQRIYKLPPTFEQFIEEHPEFIEYYRYPLQIERYLSLFPASQLHFILFNEILKNPTDVLINLFKFLGINTGFTPPDTFNKLNSDNSPRSTLLRTTLHQTKRILDSIPTVRKLYKHLGIERLGSRIITLNSCKKRIPPMHLDIKRKLTDLYATETQEVEKLIGKDTSAWHIINET